MSFSEMMFLLLIALIVFGPEKLPEIARKLGKITAEFRRAGNEFRAQIEDEVRKLDAGSGNPSDFTLDLGLKDTFRSVADSISRVPLDQQQILPPQPRETTTAITARASDDSFDSAFSAEPNADGPSKDASSGREKGQYA